MGMEINQLKCSDIFILFQVHSGEYNQQINFSLS